jgi:uncharacterized membrane protein YdbT with pleckstrin-like domain
VSFPQGKSPHWLPPVDARVPLLVVRRHWLALAWDLVLPALLAVVVQAGAAFVGLLSAQVVLVVLAVAVFWAALLGARWYATSFTLTPRTLVFCSGLLVRSSRVIALDTLQDVTTHQSLLGFLLGFGTVDFSMLSGVRERLRTVPDPQLVRDRIFSIRLEGAA